MQKKRRPKDQQQKNQQQKKQGPKNRRSDTYNFNVFLNCPFDPSYQDCLNAIVFVIYACGFIPRCALEREITGEFRLTKICKLIEESKYGIHDISTIELFDGFPRFNMPFELGIFFGASEFGGKDHSSKSFLALDRKPYQYKTFLSDLSGLDIKDYDSQSLQTLITVIRNWLNSLDDKPNPGKPLPSGEYISQRYRIFQLRLPHICRLEKLDFRNLTYLDYSWNVSRWLSRYARRKKEI
jgi:hypothetical protein